jgi:uncharacterized protein (TIGR02145 family)
MKRFILIISIITLTVITLSCSKDSSVVSPTEGETVTWMGKTYHTVKIGNQVWMKENLDVGVKVPGALEQTDNGIIEKYYYNNDSSNYAKYGAFYQWDEAMQYSKVPGSQGICPPGWHIPTIEEWKTLKTFVSANGNALKEVDQGMLDGIGTNTSGFSALLTGYRTIYLGFNNSKFEGFGGTATFWSSTEDGSYTPFIHMNSSWSGMDAGEGVEVDKKFGLSVRCIKNTL